MLLVVLALLLAHVVASDVLFLVFDKILRNTERPTSLRIFLYTRGLGPAALAVATYSLLVFLPGRPPAFYLVVLAAEFLVLGLLGGSRLGSLAESYRRAGAWLSAHARRPGGLWIVTMALGFVATVISLSLPIVEHDALAAAIESRIALRDSSFANYLAIEQPDPETGYYMETFRPPFLQSLYVFYGWLAGPERLDFLIRTSSPVFAVHCLILLTFAARRRFSPRAAAWAAFVLVATPIFFYMTYNNGIDTARLYLSFAALLWIVELAATGSLRVASVTGAVSGMTLFCHMLSAPLLAGGGLAFILFGRAKLPKKLAAGCVLAAVGLVTGASFHYLLASRVIAKIQQTVGTEGVAELARTFSASEIERPESPESSVPTAVESQPEPDAQTPEPPPNTAESSATNPQPSESEGSPSEAQPSESTEPTPAELKSAEPGSTESSEPASPPVLSIPEASPEPEPPARVDGKKPELAVERHAALLEARGQGRNPLQQLLFGRLQMFTGIEFFGGVFYLFWIGVLLWLARSRRPLQDRILVTAALIMAFIVLSGIRQLSWSNPRYIAGLLPIAAYVSGPLLSGLERRVLSKAWLKALLVGSLLVPLLLVTSIRGAKIEITNPGNFYSQFRSLKWVRYTWQQPAEALSVFGERYFGLGKTLRYFFSDPDEQLKQAHDYFAAVLWIRDHLPEDVRVLVFRDARFFYYSNRYGVVWYSPEIDQRKYRFMADETRLHRYLREQGITHVLVDDYSTRLPGYADRWAGRMLADPKLAEKIFDFGTARVYRLSPREAP